MHWITDQIAIGNFLDAAKLSNDIDAVLCLRENCCDESRTDVDILCLPLIDGPGNNPNKISEAIQYIHDVVSSNQKILVHCHAGRSRSVVIVARYLIEYRGMTQQTALKMISSKRDIYLSDGIEEIFNFWTS